MQNTQSCRQTHKHTVDAQTLSQTNSWITFGRIAGQIDFGMDGSQDVRWQLEQVKRREVAAKRALESSSFFNVKVDMHFGFEPNVWTSWSPAGQTPFTTISCVTSFLSNTKAYGREGSTNCRTPAGVLFLNCNLHASSSTSSLAHRRCALKSKKKKKNWQWSSSTCVVMTKEMRSAHTHNLRAQGVMMTRELQMSTPGLMCAYTLHVQTCFALNGWGGGAAVTKWVAGCLW